MAREPEELIVTVSESDSVTALLYPAASKDRIDTTIILGHGAGAGQLSPVMRLFANGLAERGFDVMTFNFVYMEKKRSAPDPKAKLEACYRAVMKAAKQHKKLKANRLVIGGKSMGGRIASQVAAEAEDANHIAALVFLGYPLHPPGKPEQLRDAHLTNVRAPMLFIQGSRDAFGTPDEIRAVVKRRRLPATLYPIEGGDHSFKVPKSSGVPQEKVFENIMTEISDWSRVKLSNK